MALQGDSNRPSRDGRIIIWLTLIAVVAGGISAGGFVGSASAADGPTPVENCTVIEEPGTYELKSNLTAVNSSQLHGDGWSSNSYACIDVRASDVVLNGNGSAVDWDHEENTVDQRGVYVNGSDIRRTNVTVRNLTVTDWPRGILVENSSGVLVENVSVDTWHASDAGGQVGITFRGVADSTVRASDLNEYPGGITATDAFGRNDDNRFVDNTIRTVGDISIHDGQNTTVRNNELTTDNSTVWGITIDGEGGTVSDNLVDGGVIWTDGTNLSVSRNTVRNTDIDISSGTNNKHYALEVAGSGHDVRNNTVEDTDRGIAVSGSDHVLRDNDLRDNRENFHVGRYSGSGGTDFGSLDVDTSNIVDGEPVYLYAGVSDHEFDLSHAGYLAYADSADITVRDVQFQNNTEGLFVHNVSGLTVENVTMTQNSFGVYARGTENVTVRDSRFADNTLNGIQAATSRGGDASGNWSLASVEITDNGFESDRAQRVEGHVGAFLCCSNLTIVDSTVSNNSNGIAFGTGSGNVTLRNTTVADNDGDGVWMEEELDYAGRSTFAGNTISNNGKNGIIAYVGTVQIANNTFVGNGESGLAIPERGSAERTAVIRNNTARANTYGIALYDEDISAIVPRAEIIDDNVLVDNEVTGNQYGIYVADRAENNTIRNNIATGNDFGIYLERVAETRVVDNNVSDNSNDGVRLDGYYGVRETDMNAFVIENNTALDNGGDGIELEDAADGERPGPFLVRENRVRENGDIGIVVQRSDNVTVADNGRVTDNGGSGISVEHSDNASVRNHTVVGNGAGLLVMASEAAVENVNASANGGSGVTIMDTERVDVGSNITANENNGSGIRIIEAGEVSFGPSVSASDNAENGVLALDSYDVHLDGVPADRNGAHGIEFEDTRRASVRNLTASDNGATGLTIDFDNGPSPDDVTVRNVTLRRNAVGADIRLADGTTIANSTIADSDASKGHYRASTGFADDDYVVVNGTGLIAESATNTTVVDSTIASNDGRGIVMTRSVRGTEISRNAIEDNGGNGVEFVGASGSATVSNSTIADNGGTALYGPSTKAVNGDNGVRLRDASNVTVADSSIERHPEHGVRIRGNSDDNTIRGNVIRSHTSGDGSGHGVFVESFLLDTPAGNVIAENEISDNDYGVTLFDDHENEVRGNDVLGNTIGVRVGSSTEPVSTSEGTECTDDGPLEMISRLGGSTDGTITDNTIESDLTALKLVIYPSQIVNCDGTIESVSYDDPTVEGYVIANNRFDGPEPLNVSQTRRDLPGDTFDAELNGTNSWNASKSDDGNVLGGAYRAGNYWATPTGSGFSQTCADGNDDGICDSNRTISTNNVDELPLATDQPAYATVELESTTSPVVVGEALSVTATLTNTGDESTSQNASLSIDDTEVDATSISLAADETTTETFAWTPANDDVGTHTATVASEDASESTGVAVEPNVSVSIGGTNAPITETETLVVEATAENNRDEPITETIELRAFDGAVVDTRDVSIDAGTSTSLSLKWTTAVGDAGTGDVTVRSEHDAATANVTVRSGAITSCTELTEPGRYRLESDLAASGGACLEVAASDVSIDGQGYAINGSGSGTGVLVDVAAGARSNVEVSNLTVRDVSDGARVLVPDEESVAGVRVDGITTEGIDGDGLYVEADEDGTVTGLTVEDSDLTAGDDGLEVEAYYENATFSDVRVANTTITADDAGSELDVGYDDVTIDGFEFANNTVDAEGLGIDLEADDTGITVREVRIVGNAVNASYSAVEIDYGYDDTVFESATVERNRLRSTSGAGIAVFGDDDRAETRDVVVSDNDVTAGSTGVLLEFDYDDVVVDQFRLEDNRIETDDSVGVWFKASDSGVSVEEAVLRNNTIDSASAGVELELGTGFSTGSAYDMTVARNEIRNFSRAGIDVHEVRLDAPTEVWLRNNDVHNASGDVTGIEIDTATGDSSAEASLRVTDNDVRTGGDAIVVDSDSDRVGAIEITRNVLAAAGYGVDNRATDVDGSAWVNATGNYWNASDGPGSAGPYEDPVTGALANGAGSNVTAGTSEPVSNVRFDPFLRSPPDELAPAFITVETLTTNTPVTEGETLTVEAVLENTGDVEGTRTVTLTANGTQRDAATVTLAGGENTTVTLTWSTADGDAGNYSAAVETGDDTASTTVRVEESTSTCIDEAVAGDDGVIQLDEIQEAIDWWATDEEVPGTDGETISLQKIQELIDAWATDATVSC